MNILPKWCVSFFSSLLLIATGAFARAEGVQVLIYHEVLAETKQPGETVISLAKFKEQMKYLHENHYTTIGISDLVNFMKGGPAPKKPILLSFDDGWKDALIALPVLEEYHFKASFFVFPGKGIGQPYMEWNDVMTLAEKLGLEICSHTLTHPWDRQNNLVTWIDGKTAGRGEIDVRYELSESKRLLESRLNRRVTCLAWPVGWYNEALIEIAKSVGYEVLFTAEDGINPQGGDLFRIKRIFVDGACDRKTFELTLKDHRYHVCQAERRPTKGHSPYN